MLKHISQVSEKGQERFYRYVMFSCNHIGFFSDSVPDKYKPPKFTRPLQDITILEGTEARLECKVESTPRCDVEWYYFFL